MSRPDVGVPLHVLAFGGSVRGEVVVPGGSNQMIGLVANRLGRRFTCAEPEPAVVLRELDPRRPVLEISDHANRRTRLTDADLERVDEWLTLEPEAAQNGLLIVGGPSVGADQYKGSQWVTRQMLQILQLRHLSEVAVVGQSWHLRDYALDLVRREYRRGGVRVTWDSLSGGFGEDLALPDRSSDQPWARSVEAWTRRARWARGALMVECGIDIVRERAMGARQALSLTLDGNGQ